MSASCPRFHFHADAQVLGICSVALEGYPHAKLPEDVGRALKAQIRGALRLFRDPECLRGISPSPSLSLSWLDSILLGDAVRCLLEKNQEHPHLGMLMGDDRRHAEHLVAALGDFDFTQSLVCQEHRRSLPVKRWPTEADREEQRDREKRDAIFRRMVDHVDIWGEVVEDLTYRRQEARTENFRRPYGNDADAKDLRKHAKNTNFVCHPLQSSSIRLDGPDVKERVADLNVKLKEAQSKIRGLFKTAARNGRVIVSSSHESRQQVDEILGNADKCPAEVEQSDLEVLRNRGIL